MAIKLMASDRQKDLQKGSQCCILQLKMLSGRNWSDPDPVFFKGWIRIPDSATLLYLLGTQ